MNKDIGQIFKKFRKEKGLTLEQASKGVVSTSQLSHFERGAGDITVKKFFLLLENISISEIEFSQILRDYQQDSDRILFQMIGKFEESGDIDGLVNLYNNEQYMYLESSNKQKLLNSIAMKSVLIRYGKFNKLTSMEIEVLEDYFYKIEVWSKINIKIFSLCLLELDSNTICFYLDDILDQKVINNQDLEYIELIVVALRNTIYVLTERHKFSSAQLYMKKFREMIPKEFGLGLRVSYAIQEANLFEKLGEIDKAITIFQNIINCYESFDMKDRIDILKDELKKLRKKS